MSSSDPALVRAYLENVLALLKTGEHNRAGILAQYVLALQTFVGV
jgi:hypothetical protein